MFHFMKQISFLGFNHKLEQYFNENISHRETEL